MSPPIVRDAIIGVTVTLGFSILVFLLLLSKSFKGLAKIKQLIGQRDNTGLIIGFVFAYAMVFGTLSILKFNAYNMGPTDLANKDQFAWNMLENLNPEVTREGWSSNYNYFYLHIEPIHLLIAPVFWLWDDARALLVVQTLFLSLGALPLYWMARDVCKRSGLLPLILPLVYLLFPSLQYANLFDYHGDTLAVSLLLFTFYYLAREKTKLFFLFLLLALMCKEYIALIGVTLGVHALWAKRRFWLGMVTITLSCGWFFGINYLIHKLATGSGFVITTDHASPLGGSPLEILATMFSSPQLFFDTIASFSNVGYSILLLLPVGFLCFLAPRILLIAAPIYGGMLIFPGSIDFKSHHPVTLIPFILLAALYGAERLQEWFQRLPDKPYLSWLKQGDPGMAVPVFMLSCGLLANVFFSPSPISREFWDPNGNGHGRYYYRSIYRYNVTEHDRLTDRFIEAIPVDAAVSVSGHLRSHMTHRETCYIFPATQGILDAEYILVDVLETYFEIYGDRSGESFSGRDWVHQELRALLTGDDFHLVRYEDGLFLLKRTEPLQDRPAQSLPFALEFLDDDQHQSTPNRPGSFSNYLELCGFQMDPSLQHSGTVTLTYLWRALKNIDKALGVVTDIEAGGETYRLLHVPSYILKPLNQWKQGEQYRETIQWRLPEGIALDQCKVTISIYEVPLNDAVFFRGGKLLKGTVRTSIPRQAWGL